MEETIDPRKSVVTEMQLSDISDDVGTFWRELGPKLKIDDSKIHNLDDENRYNRDKANALLIIWKQQEASGALAGLLADALESIGRKSIAEKLLGPLPGKPCVDIKDNVESNDSNQIDKLLQKIISEMQTNCKSLPTMCKHLEEEGFKVRAKIKELQEKLSNATQKNQDVEQEPESLPEKTRSEPCGGVDSSKKASRRKCTDPGARQKQIKPPEQATSSGTCDDKKFEASFTKFKKTSMKSIFKKKESNDNCYPVSYSSHRDS